MIKSLLGLFGKPEEKDETERLHQMHLAAAALLVVILGFDQFRGLSLAATQLTSGPSPMPGSMNTATAPSLKTA